MTEEPKNIIPVDFGGAPFVHLGQLRDAIIQAIYEHAGQISIAEAIGVLRIIEHELLTQSQEQD